MDNFEKAEKIREKCGVSFEAAKDALEKNNYDLLDAIVYLEQTGQVKKPEQDVFVSVKDTRGEERFEKTQKEYKKRSTKRIRDYIKDIIKLFAKIFKKSVETSFVVEKNDRRVVAFPVLILIILFLFAFWVSFPLIIVGLFFDCRYHFEGLDTISVDVNKFCDKASEGAQEIKKNFAGSEKDNEEEK